MADVSSPVLQRAAGIVYGCNAIALVIRVHSFNPSQIHTVSPSNLPFFIQLFCSGRTWRSKILSSSSVLSVADPGGISAAGQAAGEISLYRKEFRENVRQIFYHSRGGGKRLVGNHRHPAAPWRAIQDEQNLSSSTVPVIANNRSMRTRPSPCAGATCCPTASGSLTPKAKPPRAGRCFETACVNGVA